MTDTVYTVQITHKIPERLLRDIIITGCEGGIGYWSVIKEYDGIGIDDGKPDALPLLVAVEEYDGNGPWQRLGIAEVVQGIRAILTYYPNGVTARNLMQALGDNDGSYLDSSDADNIIQCGLLGEIVYG